MTDTMADALTGIVTLVFPRLLKLHRLGRITRDELFGSLTAFSSYDPVLLRDARLLLDDDADLRAEFETWLACLTRDTVITLGVRSFSLSPALISLLNDERSLH